MNFLIISHAIHKTKNQQVFSYAPYVREMNVWLKYVDNTTVIAPKTDGIINAIEMPYEHKNLKLESVPGIQFTSVKHIFLSLLNLPLLFFKLFRACQKADHIHLRCPGNMGLLGCVVQIFFPKKAKTAKYAGNWDPEATQPLSYRFQKWLLANTFLTRNMQVLVYGDWENQSKNIKPFFTATYKASEIETISTRDYSKKLKFVFIGSLVIGKRPLLAIQIIETLKQKGYNVSLDLFGDGNLKDKLSQYVSANKLYNIVTIHGNQSKDVVKAALKTAHFSILPSKSEGWPKAIAEAMFFGCVPVVTKISCVPFMLDYGKRGILITAELEAAIQEIEIVLEDEARLKVMSENALKWSQDYTLDKFEKEIAKLLQH